MSAVTVKLNPREQDEGRNHNINLSNNCFEILSKSKHFRATRDSSVSIATDYGLDGPGIENRNAGGGEIFRTRPDRPWGPPSLLYNGYRVFPGGKAAGAWC
jgi:hypothetical protein